MLQNSYDGKPTLYLISTPIGNLDDITYRSVKILNDVDVIFSEDTRVTLNLLNYLGINKKLIALHEHNEDMAKEKVLEYLKNGNNIALVTDRGTPIISDPGYKIVEYISKVHDRLPEIRSITGNRHDRSQRLIFLPENDKAKQKDGSTDKHRNGINARPYKV